jgi:hypothetical protein
MRGKMHRRKTCRKPAEAADGGGRSPGVQKENPSIHAGSAGRGKIFGYDCSMYPRRQRR